MTNIVQAWATYFYERFNPFQYLLLVSVFFGAHYTFMKENVTLNNIEVMLLLLMIFLFFFLLRLYDDIKDITYDKKVYPERPLPRGLLTKKQVLIMIKFLIASIILISTAYTIEATVLAIITIGYSLLMYKEFFISGWLRDHLTTYAVSHTAIVILFSYIILLALEGSSNYTISISSFYFILAAWPIFTIFEISRKTLAPSEEKENIKTYSKIFSLPGALLIVLLLAGLGGALLDNALGNTLVLYVFFLLGVLIIFSTMFLYKKTFSFAKLYRNFSTLYILLVYSAVIFVS